MKINNSFVKLKSYCEKEQFKGWDPYDGLNSKVFQALPFFKKSALCRLVVIQGFKRCPFNLRRIAMVPKEHNAKGIGLFLSGYCNLYNAVKAKPELAKVCGILQRRHQAPDLPQPASHRHRGILPQGHGTDLSRPRQGGLRHALPRGMELQPPLSVNV